MTGRPLRIGILGAARIAPPALVHPARSLDGVAASAIAARDPKRAEVFAAEHGIPTVYPSYAELVQSRDVDAVYNPLPAGLHCEWSVRALRAGKHVLCEKPFASNASEAQQMADVARETGLVLVEAFHYRYHPVAHRMIALARNALGPLEQIDAEFSVPIPKGDIRFDYALGGGASMDLGCYPVHMVRHVTGEEPGVISAEAIEEPARIDLSMRAQLRFPSGIEGSVSCSMAAGVRIGASLRVRGSRGLLTVTNPLAPHAFPHEIALSTDAGESTESLEGDATYLYQLRAFEAAVRGGAPLPTGPADAVANMRVLDAMYRAAGLTARGAP